MPPGLRVLRRGGIGNFPGQVEQVGHAQHHEDRVAGRPQIEKLHDPDANADHQHRHSDPDAGHMRDGPAKAEIGPRRHEHQVVGPGRDHGHKGKGREGGEKLDSHGCNVMRSQPQWNCVLLCDQFFCAMFVAHGHHQHPHIARAQP